MQYEVEARYPSIGLSELPSIYADDVPRTRSNATRAYMFACLLIAFVMPFFLAGIIGAQIVDGSGYATPAEYETARDHATLFGYLACLPLHLLFFAKVAPKVSYRSRDAFMIFIPIFSYVFAVKVLWRLTSMNDRPWQQSIDELYADDES